ncbi:hypothetical protein ACIGO8_06305 [Streptomyces sp. NPDC053493]|uniref:hypothetical protein n=1 Tax=Streptomyces sp. NPDC053493 TaxID=3365705 RepID=UPI0037D23319
MQHSTTEWLIGAAVLMRVFGGDAVRCGRRLLAAAVRRAVSDLGSEARRRAGAADDVRCEVRG